MADRSTTNPRRRLGLATAICCFVAFTPSAQASQDRAAATTVTGEAETEYQFLCDDDGTGLSIVDVLGATGDHQTFLTLIRRYDPEGFEILSDPELADKTVWAPTDAAFDTIDATLSTLSDAEIKNILGYHITPPRRTPEGPYPIVTPEFLVDGGEVVHQTRTGILTGSDQRVRTRVEDAVLTVETSTIGLTSWCTQTGSVFSIDTVITDASALSLAERVVYTLFFRNPALTLLGLGAIVVTVVLRRRRRSTALEPAT